MLRRAAANHHAAPTHALLTVWLQPEVLAQGLPGGRLHPHTQPHPQQLPLQAPPRRAVAAAAY